MTVLVTGAAGFIGAHVCRALAARNDTVVGLDNYNAYYDPQLKRDRVTALCPDVYIRTLDLTDQRDARLFLMRSSLIRWCIWRRRRGYATPLKTHMPT